MLKSIETKCQMEDDLLLLFIHSLAILQTKLAFRECQFIDLDLH